MPNDVLNSSFTLPCGFKLENRIAKAALTEHLAEEDGMPNKKHFTLYEKWGKCESAFLLTGNVMIDRSSLEGVGNVVLDESQPADPFKQWSNAVKSEEGNLWMQIGHAGGLSPCKNALSPSGIQHVGKMRQFPKPRVATVEEIHNVIERFKYAAVSAKKFGFTGIEIHSAHGFLLNQFLSPLTNRREDEWGGSVRKSHAPTPQSNSCCTRSGWWQLPNRSEA